MSKEDFTGDAQDLSLEEFEFGSKRSISESMVMNANDLGVVTRKSTKKSASSCV